MSDGEEGTQVKTARVPTGVSAAIKSGQAMADDVIAFRTGRNRRRAAAVRRMARADHGERQPRHRFPPGREALLGTPVSEGVLIAEGDSWFDYPFHDALQMLEDDYLYDVESVAHKGDTVEDMAHSGGQFEEFARRLEKVLRD
ncbi:MAG TPA: hypothetical protein VN838_24580 [Bradyrhizobium sp.]|nr:hypothetical protein [Bradyrhizobium sp.]